MAKKKTDDKPVKKKRKKKPLLWGILLLVVWYYNNFTLKTTHTEYKSDSIVSPVKAAVISDLHAMRYGISGQAVLECTEKEEPDIIFILGDMYTFGSPQELIDIPVEMMTDLVRDGYPVYFVPGEHDNDQEYLDALSAAGVHVMDYKCETIDLNGNVLRIMGIDNAYYSDTFDLSGEFSVSSGCDILMAHIPNYDKFAEFGADITLCADTHGGMFRLPFIGPVYDNNSGAWFPRLSGIGTIYDKGWFSYDGGAMFITSGIGASPAPVRFNNRPEVVIMDIVPE